MKALLKGKKFVIMGVANQRSIAWAIAKGAYQAGAEIAITYLDERIKKKILPMIEKELPEAYCFQCDITSDESIHSAFQSIQNKWGKIDGLVHSIAFANREDLEGDFLQTSRDGYALAQDVSAYSLIAVTRAAQPLMVDGGSVVTMTYVGAERVIPSYKVMGVAKAALEANVKYLAEDVGPKNIRVNGISAGPIRTLAAYGVKNFSAVLETMKQSAPLRRNTDVEEVADTAVFLLSHLSRGITGEIIHVDNGFNIIGM